MMQSTVKKCGFVLGIFIFLSFFNQIQAYGDNKPIIAPKEHSKPPPPPPVIHHLPPQPIISTPAYTRPGIVVLKNGAWEGNDYLYNLTNQIGIEIEIHKPVDAMINVSDSNLRSIVEASFRRGGITPIARNSEDEPSLPFYHVEILIYPIGQGQGYAVMCEARLFEAVSTKRVILDRGNALQVITWENQKLLVMPSDLVIAQIEKTVGEMADSFTQLFQFYESVKKR